jgi:hypothetical protein
MNRLDAIIRGVNLKPIIKRHRYLGIKPTAVINIGIPTTL